MEQKIKIIIIGLIVITAVFIFLFLSTLNSHQQVVKERDALKERAEALNNQVDKLSSDVKDRENKIATIGREIERLTREKQEVERKYQLADKARAELIEKLKGGQAQQQQAGGTAIKPQIVSQAQANEAYWAGILKAKTDLEFQLDSLRGELKNIQLSNEQLQREKASLELSVTGLKRDKDDLQRQIEYNQKIMDSISQELVREKNDKVQIQDSIKTFKNENIVLARQISTLNNQKSELERRMLEVQDGKVDLENKFNGMKSMLASQSYEVGDLKDKLDSIRQDTAGAQGGLAQGGLATMTSVELPPIVVRPPSPGADDTSGVGLGGKIVAVNKDSNFVVIDIGEDAGLRLGSTFQVYREDKPIADITVIQTRKTISACDIKKEFVPIKVGDTVR